MKKIFQYLTLIFITASLVLTAPSVGYCKKKPKKPKNAFNIMMNYELGMHCTGFEFSYCCILPPYNSILAQVVKTEKDSENGKPKLMEADPNIGLDRARDTGDIAQWKRLSISRCNGKE